MTRARAVVVLLAHFLWEVVASGFATAWLIVRPGARPAAAVVEMPVGDLSRTGAALFVCLVTLTPGTSAVDLDLDRRCVVLHLLDGSDPAGSIAAIRRRFERHLEVVCPRRGR
jgi:multisubunit Na+/H+ antiporter MnhE subunit